MHNLKLQWKNRLKNRPNIVLRISRLQNSMRSSLIYIFFYPFFLFPSESGTYFYTCFLHLSDKILGWEFMIVCLHNKKREKLRFFRSYLNPFFLAGEVGEWGAGRKNIENNWIEIESQNDSAVCSLSVKKCSKKLREFAVKTN